ncbi:MAG: hypothetical protein Q8P68_01695 [Candidatus Peregrinibacteria bacterium]|nr:hypothetical protein [Candidatus Peregrinibacteria bacterium]MDZ4244587.1 hypothetical protein [Candidatus Gracilibacteria bacterium]
MNLAEILEQAGDKMGFSREQAEAGLDSLGRVSGLVVANETPAKLTDVIEEARDAIGVTEAKEEETVMPSSLDEDGLVRFLTPQQDAQSLPTGEALKMVDDLDWLTSEEGKAVA